MTIDRTPEYKQARATCPDCGTLNVTIMTAPAKRPKMFCTNCPWDSLESAEE